MMSACPHVCRPCTSVLLACPYACMSVCICFCASVCDHATARSCVYPYVMVCICMEFHVIAVLLFVIGRVFFFFFASVFFSFSGGRVRFCFCFSACLLLCILLPPLFAFAFPLVCFSAFCFLLVCFPLSACFCLCFCLSAFPHLCPEPFFSSPVFDFVSASTHSYKCHPALSFAKLIFAQQYAQSLISECISLSDFCNVAFWLACTS